MTGGGNKNTNKPVGKSHQKVVSCQFVGKHQPFDNPEKFELEVFRKA
jgi:hypothetical protein